MKFLVENTQEKTSFISVKGWNSILIIQMLLIRSKIALLSN